MLIEKCKEEPTEVIGEAIETCIEEASEVIEAAIEICKEEDSEVKEASEGTEEAIEVQMIEICREKKDIQEMINPPTI